MRYPKSRIRRKSLKEYSREIPLGQGFLDESNSDEIGSKTSIRLGRELAGTTKQLERPNHYQLNSIHKFSGNLGRKTKFSDSEILQLTGTVAHSHFSPPMDSIDSSSHLPMQSNNNQQLGDVGLMMLGPCRIG
jgi:hypothetical protein